MDRETYTKEKGYCPKCGKEFTDCFFDTPVIVEGKVLREVWGSCVRCHQAVELHQKFTDGRWQTFAKIFKGKKKTQPAVVLGQGDYKKEVCFA